MGNDKVVKYNIVIIVKITNRNYILNQKIIFLKRSCRVFDFDPASQRFSTSTLRILWVPMRLFLLSEALSIGDKNARSQHFYYSMSYLGKT